MVFCWLIPPISLPLLKIKGLQNDHKAIMKEIENGIHEVHAQAREKKENEKQNQDKNTVEGLYFSTCLKYMSSVILILLSHNL